MIVDSEQRLYPFATDPDGNCGHYTIGGQYEGRSKHNNLRLQDLVKNNIGNLTAAELKTEYDNKKNVITCTHKGSYNQQAIVPQKRQDSDVILPTLKEQLKTLCPLLQKKDKAALSTFADGLYTQDGVYGSQWWFAYYRMKEFLAAYLLNIAIKVYVQSKTDKKLHYIGPKHTNSERSYINLYTDAGAVHDTMLIDPTNYVHLAYALQHEKEYFALQNDMLQDTSAWKEEVQKYTDSWLKNPSDDSDIVRMPRVFSLRSLFGLFSGAKNFFSSSFNFIFRIFGSL